MKTNKVYVADFETRCSDQDIANKETSVWLWDICDTEDYSHTTGKTIETFFEEISHYGDAIIYFHNLSNFDGFFIFDYLLTHKFRYMINNKLKSNQYTALIDEVGVVYNIVVCLDDGRSKHKKRSLIEFRDSIHKIRGKVRDIAKTFNLPILKGEIDYNKHRPSDYEPTEEEISYIHNDTEIVARVLKLEYDRGMTNLTSAGDTFSIYKAECGTFFRSLFPELNIETDTFIRNAYRGGACMVNPKYQDRILDETINVYDVNSMYPNQMCNELLPYSHPLYEIGEIKKDSTYPLFIQHIEVDCRLKEGHFPCILLNNSANFQRFYLVNTEGEMLELTLTNIDLELLKENYEIYEINYIDGYKFLGSKNLFKKYILPLYDMKCKTRGAEKELYKLLINSLYGKFAMAPNRTNRIPFLNNGIVDYALGDEVIVKPIYTAVSCFITSYARKQLYGVINAHKDTFVYCDTDSVHLLNDTLPDELVDDKRLGAWKLEKVYYKSKYLGTKKYMGYRTKEYLKSATDTGVDTKLAGCPDEVKATITIENFKIGASFYGKLLPMRVKGGVILMPTTFTIKG